MKIALPFLLGLLILPVYAQEDNLHVGSGGTKGRPVSNITTTIIYPDGKSVHHGLSVDFYENGVLRSFSEWRRGKLIRMTQCYRNGMNYRYRLTIPAAQGLSNEVLYDTRGEIVCSGTMKGRQHWAGEFLLYDSDPKNAYAPGTIPMLYRFREGAVIGKEPFPVGRLKLLPGMKFSDLPQAVDLPSN